ncbi:MAG TPA: transglycosylase SLT domain-containing protein [Gemmatirosa sp.]
MFQVLPRCTALLRSVQTRHQRLAHQLTLAAGAVVSMAAAVSSVRPVYVGREPALARLVVAGTWRDSVSVRAPWAAVDDADAALKSPRFETDRLAFVQDLLHTGRMDSTRAQSVGTFAVREAYKHRLPPALVFGVLLTENRTFRSTARSNVGAVGLMQIVPRVWLPTLGKLFGRNLTHDETNLQYGIHILSHYLYDSAEQVATADSAVFRGLLRYNGCVRGTNTRGCRSYPDKVRQMVEQYAAMQCGAVGYEGCVTQPLRVSMGEATGEDSTSEQVATR